jgi:uncharacterized iron-regulated membrane protein
MAYFGALATRIHVVMGLVLGLFFAILGVTGAGLAFRPSLEAWLYWPAAGPGNFSWESAANLAQNAAGGKKIQELRLREGRAWEFVARARDGSAAESIYVNPATGSLAGRREHASSPFDWMYRIHTGFVAGRFGVQVVSRLGLLLVLQGALGLLVWRLRGYPVHIHALLGISVGVASILLGYGGWRILTKPHPTVTPVVTLRGVENKVSLDRIVTAALARRSGQKLAAVYFPGAPSQPFQFWFGERPSDGIVYMDPYGAVMPMLVASENDETRDWHSGPAGGGGARAVRTVAGIGLALLFVTGASRSLGRRFRPVSAS